MDEEDAEGVLIQWMEVLAHTITNGMVGVGGEISTDFSSTGGYDYSVEVTSAPFGPAQAELLGRIRQKGTRGPVLERRAEIDLPEPDAPDD